MPDFIGTNATETLNGSETADTVTALGGSDKVDGLGGDDTVSGGDGTDTLKGGAGNDILYGHSVADLDPNSSNITATLLTNVGGGAVFVTGAPGDDGFVYAVRKDVGDILRINTTTGAQTTFLDIPPTDFLGEGERGVLSVAFHPDYEDNGRFFVFLTNPAGDIEVREYARSAGSPPTSDPTSAEPVITIPHPTFGNHNGGTVAFGPDGYLHISVGDGGGANDPNGNAQNINSLLGKILRIDIDGDDFPGDPARNYAIPADNPFAGATPGAGEIWALGLRNPFRVSFDPLTGDFYIADVGQNAREEVNFDAAGGPGGSNYGWDFREGKIQGPSAPPVPPIAFTGPVFDYPHSIGQSVTGGYVYRGPAPGLEGAYFFADFVSGRVFTLRMTNGMSAEAAVDRTSQIVGADLSLISSFGTDNDGNLYVVTLTGAIYRLDPGIAAGDAADMIDGGVGDDSLFGGIGNDTLLGAQGNDVMTGGAGNDSMGGGAGNDTYVIVDGSDIVNESIAGSGIDTVQSSVSFSLANSVRLLGAVENLTLTGSGDTNGSGNALGNAIAGNGGVNVLTGLGGNDLLQGFGGNDWLDGGTGKDTLKGSAGNDTYVIDFAGDQIDEEGNLDSGDTVRSTIKVDLVALGGGAIEHAVLLGAGAVGASGNDGANVLTGNKGANILDGRGGADTMSGGDGADTYVVDGADKIAETNAKAAGGIDVVKASITFALGDNLEKLTLTGDGAIDGTGNGLNNTLLGNGANNRLDGGGGKDAMTGGQGNDTYVVDSTGDVVTELVGGGIDTVESAITFSLATRPQVEHLTLTGAAANATGNALGNLLTGNAFANILDGLTGVDILRGGAGNDLYIVDKAGDVVDEQSNTDTGDEVKSAGVQLAAIAGIEHYTFTGAAAWAFTGNGADNRISGGSGANNLDGAGGNDTLLGNGGNDTLMGGIGVDSLDGGTGNDLMKGGAGNDTYVVNAAGDKIDEEGNADTADLVRASVSVNLATLANSLIENATLTGAAAINATGNVGINHLIGNDGANTLNGDDGADILEGGKGADIYMVDDLGDQVIEALAGAPGGIDLVKSEVSFTLDANLEKLTLLGSADIDATGNNLNNTLLGNAGANILKGGAGSDAMTGGKGDDTYIVDSAGDAVIEASGGGTDTVESSVTFSLASRVNVEHLELTGVGKINGTGNALANSITGNDADNIIMGAAGNDTLTGGKGADRLTGGTGRDVFDYDLVAESGDTITDFAKGAAGDVLDLRDILDNAGYGGSDPFGDGVLSFTKNGANTRVLIDADGPGGSDPVLVVTLNNVILTDADTANYLV